MNVAVAVGVAFLAAETDAPPLAREHFVKGALTDVGARELASGFSNVTLAAGPSVVGSDYFLNLTPSATGQFGTWSYSFQAPLNLLAYEGGSRGVGSFRVRREDWQDRADYARVLRFVRIGRKEEEFYLSVDSLRPASVGHGQLIDRYQPQMDVDRSMTGVSLDGHNDFGGFQLYLNDLTLSNRVIGGLAFFRPLALVSDHLLARTLSVGVELAGDLRAPLCVRVVPKSDTCVQGQGQVAGRDQVTGLERDDSFVRTGPSGRYAVKTTQVRASGVSAEVKLLRTESVDFKLFGTWHRFANRGGGAGRSLGVLWRMSFGEELVHALRLRAAYQHFDDGFLPRYFDTMYEISKYEAPALGAPYQATPTKYQAVFGDPENGFARPKLGTRQGFDVQLAYALFQGQFKRFAVAMGLSDSSTAYDTSGYVHLEFPLSSWLQGFATVLHQNDPDLHTLVTKSWPKAQNAVMLAGVRLGLLGVMFLTVHYSSSFQTVRSPGSEYHLGTREITDSAGKPTIYPTSRLFELVPELHAQLELGWEFDRE